VNQTVHQFLQLVLQGITWAFRMFETLWAWSWAQIASLFALSWGELPGWKLALGLIALGVLIALLIAMALRGWEALVRIILAIRTTAVTLFVLLALVVTGALFSRGFQWVVATVPDRFWDSPT
jgi:CHASE2 domain-containing sensor protein